MSDQIRTSGENPTMTEAEFKELSEKCREFKVIMPQSVAERNEVSEEIFRIFTERSEKSISEMSVEEKRLHREKIQNAIRVLRTMSTVISLDLDNSEREMNAEERHALHEHSVKQTAAVKARMQANKEVGDAREKGISLLMKQNGISREKAAKLFESLLND